MAHFTLLMDKGLFVPAFDGCAIQKSQHRGARGVSNGYGVAAESQLFFVCYLDPDGVLAWGWMELWNLGAVSRDHDFCFS